MNMHSIFHQTVKGSFKIVIFMLKITTKMQLQTLKKVNIIAKYHTFLSMFLGDIAVIFNS